MELVSTDGEKQNQNENSDARHVTFQCTSSTRTRHGVHRVPFSGLRLDEVPLESMYARVLRTVKCPYGVKQGDWIAVKLVDLFSELSVLCNAISEICTEQTCPIMKAGPHHEYAWADPASLDYASPVLVSAPKYMELLMTWVERHLTSVDSSNTNTGSFNINNRIFSRRLFRVYAHIYSDHCTQVSSVRHHLDYSLMHFLVFINEYDLMVNHAEIDPIIDIIRTLGISNLQFKL